MDVKWIVVALLFFIIEILTPGVFLFSCFGIGAIVAFITSIFSNSLILQCIIFALSSVLSIYFLKPILMRILAPLTVKSNVESLIGQEGIVVEKIYGKKSMGIVKVDSELWRAVSENDEIIEKDEEVVVLKVEGVHLVVKKKI
ncbi:MAG: NfeD family protein [Endomicrobiia bacterium]